MTAISIAVSEDYYDVVKALLDAGANANGLTRGSRPLLHEPLRIDNRPLVDLLLEHGADPNAVVDRTFRVYFTAVHMGYHEMVRTMLTEYGGYFNLVYGNFLQPTNAAARQDDVRMLELLLDHGAEIDSNRKAGTPLLQAIDNRAANAAAFLLERGADPNLVPETGWSPLQSAVDTNALETVRALVDHGADVMYKDDDGWTALHMAVMNGNNRALEMLLNQPGVDINVATNEGRTLVHQAAKSGRTETLKLLVERGARVDVTNAAGATPLDLAIKEGRSKAAEYLKSLETAAG